MTTLRFLLLLGAAAVLQACAATDPQLNTRDWTPTGANNQNLAAEIVDPIDLLHGRAATGGADADRSAVAVSRLRADKVKPLPDSGVSDFQVRSSGSGSTSGTP